MPVQIEGLTELTRALVKADAQLAQELTSTTLAIGQKVAAVLPGSGNDIPLEHFGPHVVELWGPDVKPGQEPRPFILASRLGELPDVEAEYSDAIDRVIRKISS